MQAYIGQVTLERMRREPLRAHPEPAPVLLPNLQPGQVINSSSTSWPPVSGFIGSAVSVPLINVCTLLAMGGYLFYLNPLLAGLSFVIYPLQYHRRAQVAEKRQRGQPPPREHQPAISAGIGEVVTGVH
jgi:hypothetical protein